MAEGVEWAFEIPIRFTSVDRAAEIDCRWCMPWLQKEAVYVGRDPHQPLREVWPELKKFR